MRISVPYTVEDSAIFMRMLAKEHGCEFVVGYANAATPDAKIMAGQGAAGFEVGEYGPEDFEHVTL